MIAYKNAAFLEAAFFKLYSLCYYISLLVVFVTVTLSVRLLLFVEDLINAISNKIPTIAPTTQTHVSVYQVLVSVVLVAVVDTDELVLSCAITSKLFIDNTNRKK